MRPRENLVYILPFIIYLRSVQVETVNWGLFCVLLCAYAGLIYLRFLEQLNKVINKTISFGLWNESNYSEKRRAEDKRNQKGLAFQINNKFYRCLSSNVRISHLPLEM